MKTKEIIQKYLPIVIVIVGLGLMGKTFMDFRSGSKIVKAPDFELVDLDNQKVRLSDFKGKVVVVDFWATWCPPCIEEIPHFRKLHRQYSKEGLVIIGVSMDQIPIKRVKSFAEGHSINYPIVMGTNDVAENFGGVRALPTTFVINREGKIVKKLLGYHDYDTFESLIKAHL